MFFRKKRQAPTGPYCVCVVAAAGSSRRMGRDKLLEPLDGQSVILRTLRALEDCPYIHEIIIVTRPDLLVELGALCRDAGLGKVTQVLLGGATRLESVYRGVNQAPPKAKLIAVHDGARPLVSQELLASVITAAARCHAAAPAVELKDTVKETDGVQVLTTLDRSRLRCVQTPQVFDADLLRSALQKAVDDNADVTDDCSAVERLGATVALVPGEERNLKLTTPLDLAVAETILQEEV